jgi:hypothetical protein
LCIIGVAFWTLPGGIIGSGFAIQVEKRNKKKKFNRLVPVAATLIQSWWRMKATSILSSSKSGCLAATINTFDLTKQIKKYQSKISFRTNTNQIESKLNSNKNDNEESKFLDRRRSIILLLSTEHLILIRLILILKFFSAKEKFKSAYKPYDLKDDIIEQYTRGNKDIHVKIKDLQKKIDQLNTAELFEIINRIENKLNYINNRLEHDLKNS